MDIKRRALCCFLCFGAHLHAASFDCKNPTTDTEKAVCDEKNLSDLDSKLKEAYQRADDASSTAARNDLPRKQRSWLRFLKNVCGADKECVAAAYDDRIDQLNDIAQGRNLGLISKNRGLLNFKGLRFGETFNEKQARAIFRGLKCGDQRDNDKLMSSIEHRRVMGCRGDTTFQGQKMEQAVIELHGNHILASITLCYDRPYPNEGVFSTSVSEMENRLIATYGTPDMLRTESPHRAVQHDSKDFIPSDNAHDEGEDEWIFTNGASLTLGPCSGHQNQEGGHIFGAEGIFLDASTRPTSITIPAHHATPVIFTKLSKEPANGPLWRDDELMTVELYPGGKRTCAIGQPASLPDQSRDARYMTTMTCTDFVQMSDSAISPFPPIRVRVMRDDLPLAAGYIPSSKAVASLEHP